MSASNPMNPWCALLLLLASCTLTEGEEGPEFPNAALQWRTERMLDEHGSIPPGAWQAALQGRQALVATTATLDDGGIAPSAWVERGPFNVAGRSRTLVVDPRNANVLWSGGVSGSFRWCFITSPGVLPSKGTRPVTMW